MASFYIKYTPCRKGLTGAEYLAQFLDEFFNTITFDSVSSDGINHYGILSGSGDDLSKVFPTIEGRFSAIRLTEEEFIGNCRNFYNPITMPDEPAPPTFSEYMLSHGITVVDELAAVKAAKINLFKEISKKKFCDDNDSIADLAKSVVLLNLHYDSLTLEEKTTVDNLSNTLKTIYTKESCMSAYNKLINDMLVAILSGYYTAKTSVENATTIEEVNAVIYE